LAWAAAAAAAAARERRKENAGKRARKWDRELKPIVLIGGEELLVHKWTTKSERQLSGKDESIAQEAQEAIKRKAAVRWTQSPSTPTLHSKSRASILCHHIHVYHTLVGHLDVNMSLHTPTLRRL